MNFKLFDKVLKGLFYLVGVGIILIGYKVFIEDPFTRLSCLVSFLLLAKGCFVLYATKKI